ncbi:MAG: hypothetical protein ACI3T9_02125 [Romboutsia timonensis]
MILEKRIYKTVEHYLYGHYEISEQLELEQADIIHGCKASHLGEETGASMSTSNESKVERAALQLIELEESEESKWVNVINEAIKEFEGTEYEKLIDLTYNKQIRVTKILRLINMEKSAYYEKRNDVIMQVALKAATKGLVNNKIRREVI